MLLLLIALACACLLAPFLIKVLGRPAFGLLALVPAVGCAWILREFAVGKFNNGGAFTAHYGWMSSAHLDLTFRLDALSAFFSIIILGIGALVLFYCWGYFDDAPPRLRAFGAQMSGFAFAMYGLVIADNLLLLYVFWEVTSVLSFLLVGYYGERASSRRAAEQALMVTTLGGLAMLVGIILLGRQTNAWSFSELAAMPLEGTHHITYAVILILAGALSKSAIAPAHFWLPGAMAAPTPVSAYLHSAAMVKAGIYLIARMSPDFHFVQAWQLIIVSLGLITMLMAGWMSLKQKDLKLVLAYGTVSQLGFISTVISIGSRETLIAGLALTMAHALFKATLFMIVGAIDHTTGTRDCRKLSGLGRKQPLLAGLAIIAAASMAGIPPMFGFVAKEEALGSIMDEPLLAGMPGKMVLTGIVLGSVMTMAYSLYFLYGAFATKPESHVTGGGMSPAVAHMHKFTIPMMLPAGILAGLTVIFGIFPSYIGHLIDITAVSLYPLAPGEHLGHLALWHGWNLPLALSAVIIIGGCLVFWQRNLVSKLYFSEPALGNANAGYDAVLDFLRKISLKLTASTQRGSLTINLATIFVVLIVVPLVMLLSGERTDVMMKLWDTPLQAVAGGIIIVMAIAAAVQRNRLSALLCVGVTGFSLAFIFALYGAPDLALTQLLVETLTVVVFMLILRRFPSETQWRSDARSTRLRVWLALGVGVSVMIYAVFAMNARTTAPVSEYIPDLAKDIGHGANAVNVLLVDLRSWDTIGEISVLVITAIGIASLIYRSRNFGRDSRRPTLQTTGRRWLASDVHSVSGTTSLEQLRNRSLLIDVITRLLFPFMIVLSVYFFFAGHNAPGGGFAGGLVAGLALCLRYLAGGQKELEETIPIDPTKILGTGLIFSILTAVAPMFFGYPLLTTFYTALDIPVIGSVSITSALFFDAGVYLIVVGLVLRILDSLGGQLDMDESMRKQRARDRVRRLRKQTEKVSTTTEGQA